MLIPIGVYVPTDRRPFGTIGLIAVISLLSVLLFFGMLGPHYFEALTGVDVARWVHGDDWAFAQDHWPWPVLAVTSGFLHLDWFHLIGNMVFLWVFGCAVEYKFRHLRYLGLYLACGLVGGLAHYTAVGLPAVGASDAVYGLMGAFLVFFPRNDVRMAWLSLGRTFTVSSYWVIVAYVAWDILGIVLGWQGGTALFAHVGGFAAGFGTAFLCAYQGWLHPEEDEQTLLQLLRIRTKYGRPARPYQG